VDNRVFIVIAAVVGVIAVLLLTSHRSHSPNHHNITACVGGPLTHA
jgi:hypothetical protein